MEKDAAESLRLYREACERWFGWLDGDKDHSISGQLSQIFWKDAVFRALNEARRLTKDTGPTAAVSPFLAAFLDQGYVDGQVLGISKLVEQFGNKGAAKGVISLRRLIDDLIENQQLLTRANYIGRDGYPYDYEEIRAASIKANITDMKGGVGVWAEDTAGPMAWLTSERMHEQFDRLSGVKPSDRKPDDLVAGETLAKLSQALDDEAFETIGILRNKSVGHAADETSRKAKRSVTGIKFDDVDRAHRILAGVAQVISATILHGPWRARYAETSCGSSQIRTWRDRPIGVTAKNESSLSATRTTKTHAAGRARNERSAAWLK